MVTQWKVLGAAVVIFGAGALAGGLGVHWLSKPRPPLREPAEQPLLPVLVSEEFVRRMDRELALTPHQRQQIVQTLRIGQARIRELYSLVGPEVGEELHYVREAIRAELTPTQQKRFEDLLRKQRQRRWGERPRPEGPQPRRLPPGGPDPGPQRPGLRTAPHPGPPAEPRPAAQPGSPPRRPRTDRPDTNFASPAPPAAPPR